MRVDPKRNPYSYRLRAKTINPAKQSSQTSVPMMIGMAVPHGSFDAGVVTGGVVTGGWVTGGWVTGE